MGRKSNSKDTYELIMLLVTLIILVITGLIKFLQGVHKYKMHDRLLISLLIFLGINVPAYFLLSNLHYLNNYYWVLGISAIGFIIYWNINLGIARDCENATLWQEKSFWLKLDGWQYENEVAKLFRQCGYNAKVTKGSGDGGVDIILKKDGITTYVQCKFYNSNKIPPSCIREFLGVMASDRIFNGILIGGNEGFSASTIEFARKNSIKLMSLDDIIKMSLQISTAIC
jgi:hypothetical protein